LFSRVTLSSKNQVLIPQEARKKLGVGPGARLLVLVKEDRIVFMPEPRHFVKHSSGRHKGVWGARLGVLLMFPFEPDP